MWLRAVTEAWSAPGGKDGHPGLEKHWAKLQLRKWMGLSSALQCCDGSWAVVMLNAFTVHLPQTFCLLWDVTAPWNSPIPVGYTWSWIGVITLCQWV